MTVVQRKLTTWRAPLLVVAVLTAFVPVVLPLGERELGPVLTFLPSVLVLVAAVDLLSAYLLVREYAGTGDRRLLAMAGAYTWSLVVMLGYAGAFPGVLAADPPLMTAPSVAPWLYVFWHVGFPVALALAWAPWPGRLEQSSRPEDRTRTAMLMLVACFAAAAGVVALVVVNGPSMPVLIVGLDFQRMAQLTAPVGLPLAALSVLVTSYGLRHRTGPERWTVVAVWASLIDLVLTYGSRYRFSLGWYSGRALTVVAAATVLLAMLHEFARLQSRLRAALVESAELARLHQVVLDNLSEGVTLQDRSGLLTANPAAYALLGLSDGDLLSAEFDVVREDGTPWPRQKLPSADTLATGRSHRDVLMGLCLAGGDVRWLSVSTTPLLGPDGRPERVVGGVTDVTDREERRRLLVRSRDEALASVAAKSAFLANVSHEIRTPLNGLLGTTDLLLATDLDEHQRYLASTGRSCGQALLSLLNDVLDFSKVEAGRLELEEAPFGVRALVDSATGLVSAAASAKGLRLLTAVDDDVPDGLVGDSLRLRQVLANLLSNAVKFTAEGTVAVHVSTDGTSADRVHLLLSVTDSGIGIPEQSRTALFEPFTQADTSTARSYGGTGLGLSIVHGLVAIMGGELGMTAAPGGGSRFWCTVEVGLDPTTPDAGQLVAAELGPLTGRVLVAEDNGVNAMVAELLLSSWGLEVSCVGDGRQAVEAVAASSYDVVLMDAQMPVLDGVSATAEIRAAHGSARPVVLALSASARSEDRAQFAAAGADGYLTKPLVPAELHAVLASSLLRAAHA